MVPPGTRSRASVRRAIHRPSALIDGSLDAAFPVRAGAPAARLTSDVRPAWRSYRKTSPPRLVSACPFTRSVASLRKAIQSPSALIEGVSEMPLPGVDAEARERLTSDVRPLTR